MLGAPGVTGAAGGSEMLTGKAFEHPEEILPKFHFVGQYGFLEAEDVIDLGSEVRWHVHDILRVWVKGG